MEAQSVQKWPVRDPQGGGEEGGGGFAGWNVWKLQFNLSFGSWQFMQIRISLNPALGLNDDSLMGVSRLFRVGAEMKVLNVAQTVIRTDEPSSNSTLYTEGKCKKKKKSPLVFAFAFSEGLPRISRGIYRMDQIQFYRKCMTASACGERSSVKGCQYTREGAKTF